VTAILHDITHAAGPGTDHRHARRGGLNQRQPKILVLGQGKRDTASIAGVLIQGCDKLRAMSFWVCHAPMQIIQVNQFEHFHVQVAQRLADRFQVVAQSNEEVQIGYVPQVGAAKRMYCCRGVLLRIGPCNDNQCWPCGFGQELSANIPEFPQG